MTLLSLPEAARKKHLGQYFTGQRVGRLLASLATAQQARTIIDPMVGSGDLLASCLAVGAQPDQLLGLELDPVALAQAQEALGGVAAAELTLTDAFNASLPAEQFDLVITNPPYIRYQSQGEADGVKIPSGNAVRAGLMRTIEGRGGLSDDDRDLFLRAAASYPGTADVAVPAWILSASLVREGGALAVVAPQAWLTRNYAHAVRELLDAAFEMEVVVEDGDASWFDDALVRTQLVVARRRDGRARRDRCSVIFARATREMDRNGSLLGSLRSEHAVASALRAVVSIQPVEVTCGLKAHVAHDVSLAAAGRVDHVPARIATTLRVAPHELAMRSLESYGWRAGQGLRTGANEFFYVSETLGTVTPAPRWGLRSLALPPECLLPAVRRQSDVGESLVVDSEFPLAARVVNLRGWVTSTDNRRLESTEDVRVLPTAVCRWIEQVADSPLTDKEPSKLFPDLAAVAPNERHDRLGRPVGFWYQLPELAPRHRPALFLGRICGGHPTAVANPAGVVVDANFSTLWPVESDALPTEALFALLHSSWVWANLEATCTVLGGGALKVEATDLRRLPLPDLGPAHIARLSELGRKLATSRSAELLRVLDDAVACMVIPGRTRTLGAELRVLAQEAVGHRSPR